MDPWNMSASIATLDSRSLIISSCIIAVLGLTFSTAAQWYRLSHIPGPLVPSLTSLWAYWSLKGMGFHRILPDIQRKYGKIVRIQPNGVMLSDPETLWRINSARSSYTRGGWYSSIRFNPYGDSVFSEMDTAKHDKRKAKLAFGFSGKGLMDLEGNLDTQLAVLVNVLKSRTSQGQGQAIVDIGRMLQYFQVDLITFAGMGKAWGNLPLDKDHFHVLRKEVERRVSGGNVKDHGGDMLDEWFKHGISPAEAELDLSLQLPAGTETSITTIRGILMNLMTSPRVYQRLKREIADGLRDGRISSPIKNSEAKDLPYLQAVINEGMRMNPPVTAGFPKQVPPGGDIICGKAVPAGTEVHMNLISLMRDQDVFGHDAEIFRPERFIDCNDVTKAKRMKVVDLIFGYGRWMCLGKALAWMEMNKIFVEVS
ncbi:hypothetical protein DL765_010874 [Monosporascus sp. GIB2]|nr:hypothetical protein DL765_010874 [Monosporascus sp. GIB2]